MARTATQVQTELDAWYAARLAAANGKSITISTSAGSRTVSQFDLSEINSTISRLERELAGVVSGRRPNFAVASFNHSKEN